MAGNASSNRYGLDDTCMALPYIHIDGVCNRCGKALTGRQTQWCSRECSNELTRQHDWSWARNAAKQRDGDRCVRCGGNGSDQRPKQWRQVLSISDARKLGLDWPVTERPVDLFVAVGGPRPWLEVNHIDPRVGRGYGFGCHNHLSNLETLCHGCHVTETNRQAAERRGDPPAVVQIDLFSEVANA
ncbi:HNH endonuclease [Mycolicibacterium mucogenicum]|uniref:HNH endonuclease n=1 Tax=Mycolicibacterium mucogenicum DSM 44124 TaxID=1226753 RepID=A0A8H2JIC0_MYCMU|nr:HNH endonuclease [Mycolicibacterium mucogenicum]QPG69108.1 HNH endonuclease [Mycolicibacterium mucogenicum DSM 44124]